MKEITIIGGGLAGLTLAIQLRQHEVPVTVHEAARYPRHRVCGEFISGRGLRILESMRLGKLDLHSHVATQFSFYSERRKLYAGALPEPALTVSRFHLDAALAERFKALGGSLRESERRKETAFEEGVVWAMGRRRHPVDNGWRWFGLKVHARGVALDSDLEMHLGRNLYVGLCRLANNEVNVCGLFRRRTSNSASFAGADALRGEPGSPLFTRLEHAEFEPESFCSVAGLSLRRENIDGNECRVGDSFTMIPPITGNGMSMAFESAELAAAPLRAYSDGEMDWRNSTQEMARAMQSAFATRLRWASVFHRLLFSKLHPLTVPSFAGWGRAWSAAFAVTR